MRETKTDGRRKTPGDPELNTPAARRRYSDMRRARGTMMSVAALLGLHWTCLERRENGRVKLTREAFAALSALPEKPVKVGGELGHGAQASGAQQVTGGKKKVNKSRKNA